MNDGDISDPHHRSIREVERVCAAEDAQLVKPITVQLETMNARLNEPTKGPVEGENHVKEIAFKPA